MSYGPDYQVLHRQAAGYIDRLLKGAKLIDLPVQAPTKWEFVLNLKTAKALGLDCPDSARAAPTRSSNDPPRPHRAPREHSGLVAAWCACAAARARAAHGVFNTFAADDPEGQARIAALLQALQPFRLDCRSYCTGSTTG